MIRRSLFAVLISLSFILDVAILPAQVSHDKAVRDSLIMKVIGNIQKEKYDTAFALTDSLQRKFPDDPSGYFLEADAYQTVMRDYRVRKYEAEFDSVISLAVDISKQAVETNPTAENYFIYGASEGYRCLHLFRSGKWLKAIGAAIRTNKMLRKAQELDPDFVDPLFGLALYDYGKSKVQLFGLSLFSGKTEKIVENLNKVYAQSEFLSVNALFFLQLVYFETHQFQKEKEVNKQLLSLLPNHPVCHYYRALTLEEQDSLEDARQHWLIVMNKIENFDPSSNNYLAECNYHLAKIAYQNGQLGKARAYIREAARYIRHYREEEELNGALYTSKDIKDEINDALRKWELNP